MDREQDNIKVSKTFHKSERLNSKKQIQELFDKGSSFFLHPLKIKFLPASPDSPNQVLFSVPKRNFKKAVDRNKIKRRLRESYRSNKFLLNEGCIEKNSYFIAFIYVAKQIMPFKEIDDKLKSSLRRLQKCRQ